MVLLLAPRFFCLSRGDARRRLSCTGSCGGLLAGRSQDHFSFSCCCQLSTEERAEVGSGGGRSKLRPVMGTVSVGPPSNQRAPQVQDDVIQGRVSTEGHSSITHLFPMMQQVQLCAAYQVAGRANRLVSEQIRKQPKDRRPPRVLQEADGTCWPPRPGFSHSK